MLDESVVIHERGPPRHIDGRSPLVRVDVSVGGLDGESRFLALAAAGNVRGATSVGDLDERLKQCAAELARLPEAARIEVAPGASKDSVRVSIRPHDGWHASLQQGLNSRLDPTFGPQVKNVLPSHESRPPIVMSGLLNLWHGAVAAGLRFTPLPQLGSWYTGGIELDAREGGLWPDCGPRSSSTSAAVRVTDSTGTHAFRFEVASREQLPDDKASNGVLLGAPLKSTKTSLTYQVLSDTRPQSGAPEGMLGCGTLEVAGLAGDVSFARVHGICTNAWRFLSSTFSLTSSAGLLVPLGDGRAPLEDRFYLGGTVGGLAGRLPGYASRSVGPSSKRRDEECEYVGGCARTSVLGCLQWPLPLLRSFRLHGLVFGAAGSLVDQVSPDIIQDLVAKTRASVGFGIGTPLRGGGFVGITCAQPLIVLNGDRRQFLQVWLSLSSIL